MRILNPCLDLDRYFASLERARERVLLVDYDGTLAPFHPKPDHAAPYPRVAAILKAIGESGSSRIVDAAEARARKLEVHGARSPGAVCAYLGDDRTDEDAFQ